MKLYYLKGVDKFYNLWFTKQKSIEFNYRLTNRHLAAITEYYCQQCREVKQLAD